MTATADIDHLMQHAHAVRRLARRLVLDDDGADDVVQDACLAVLRRPPPPGVAMRAWLRGVVRNLALRRRRDERRRARREDAQPARDAAPPPEEILQRAETHRALVKAVLALPEPYGTTLLMRYFDGLAPGQIAARLDIPVATVNTRVHRGLARLRAHLDEAHGGRRLPWFLALMPLATGGSTRALAAGATAAGGALIVSAKTIAVGVVTLVVAAALFLSLRESDLGREDHGGQGAPGALQAPALAGREPPPAAATAPPEVADLPLGPLDPRRDLHGVVVDDGGAPVAGASVEAFTSGWLRYKIYLGGTAPREQAGPGATTAADGTFRIRLPRDESTHVRVRAAGFAVVERYDCPAGERLEITLPRGVRARVRVSDPDGNPVADASVRLFRRPEAGRGLSDRVGTTDATGTHVFADLPPRTWALLEVEHPRFAAPRWHRVEFPASGEVEATLVLEPGRTLAGRVLDADTGEAIAGARVGLGWTLVKAVTTDAQGRYALHGYTGNYYVDVYAQATGYGAEQRRGPFQGAVDFSLRRGATVRGRVVTAEGTPVPGAAVAAACGNLVESREAHAGRDGRFRLEGMRRESAHVLVLLAAGHGRTLVDVDVPDEDELDVGDLVIAESRVLQGRVLRADGSPAPDTPVEIDGANADRDRLRRGQPAPSTRRGNLETRRTDHLGRFRFGDLAPGRYQVTAKPVGQRWIAATVDVPEEDDPDEVTLQLRDARLLRVRVVDDAGSPVAYAHVSARAHDEYGITCMTDSAGWARFRTARPVKSVEVSLVFSEDKYLAPAVRELAEDEEAIEIAVQRARVARGRVLDPQGRPAAQVFLQVFQDGAPLRQLSPFSENQITSDYEGNFEALLPAEGRVDLVVYPTAYGGGEVLGGRLEDVGGGTSGHVLHLRPLVYDQSLRVRVLTPEGQPAKDVQVYARIQGRNIEGANVRTDAAGQATLTGLPDQGVLLHARALPGSAEADRWTELAVYEPRAAEGAYELRFENAVFVAGRVVDGDGAPVAGAFVAIANARRTVATQTTGEDGRFRLRVSPSEPFPLRLGVRLEERWTEVKEVARERREPLLVVLR